MTNPESAIIMFKGEPMSNHETRKRVTRMNAVIHEKYIECPNCGDWRWVTTSTPGGMCAPCETSKILQTREKTDIRPYTNDEQNMIKSFLKKSKPSTVFADGVKADVGMSHCSRTHY